jgi:hypothetical protein
VPECIGRKTRYSASIVWLSQATAQFRRRKVEEKLAVTDDEALHPSHEQIHLGHICQLGGWSAILADFAFTVVAIFPVLRLYAVPLAIALQLVTDGGQHSAEVISKRSKIESLASVLLVLILQHAFRREG